MKKGQLVSASFFPTPLPMFTETFTTLDPYTKLHAMMEQAALAIKAVHPQTIIILSRYKTLFPDAIGYSPQARLQGKIERNDGTHITVGMETDHMVTKKLREQSDLFGIPCVDVLDAVPTLQMNDFFLHHTATMPLYYLQQAGLGNKQIVRLTLGRLTYEEMYAFGKVIQRTAEKSGRTVALVGAANLLPERWVNRENVNLETNLVAMSALGDRKLSYLQELGYPPQDECCLRIIACLLGAVGGSDLAPVFHHYETVETQGYGLMHYGLNEA